MIMAHPPLDLNKLPTGFIAEAVIAEFLQVSLSCMRNYRRKGLISYLKPSGKVFYTAEHIKEFCVKHLKNKTSNDPPKGD